MIESKVNINYCKTCGEAVNFTQKICLKCGFRPEFGNSYCSQCGITTESGQSKCINCGFQLNEIINEYKTEGKTPEESIVTNMYCKTCGVNIEVNQKVCRSCGFEPLKGNSYCQTCGIQIKEGQVICVSCGFELKPTHKTEMSSHVELDYDRKKTVLSILIPMAGIIFYLINNDNTHKQALKYLKFGILNLVLTCVLYLILKELYYYFYYYTILSQ